MKDIHRDRSCKKRCVVARLCNVGVCCYLLKQLASQEDHWYSKWQSLDAHKPQNGYDSDSPFPNWVRSHHACTCWRLEVERFFNRRLRLFDQLSGVHAAGEVFTALCAESSQRHMATPWPTPRDGAHRLPQGRAARRCVLSLTNGSMAVKRGCPFRGPACKNPSLTLFHSFFTQPRLTLIHAPAHVQRIFPTPSSADFPLDTATAHLIQTPVDAQPLLQLAVAEEDLRFAQGACDSDGLGVSSCPTSPLTELESDRRGFDAPEIDASDRHAPSVNLIALLWKRTYLSFATPFSACVQSPIASHSSPTLLCPLVRK
jgi:hypothetical protein